MAAGSRRPDGSAFSQQTLKAWRPILTPRLVILLFVLVGLVFIPFGAVVIGVTNQVVEVESNDYSGDQCCVSGCDDVQTWRRNDSNPCSVSLVVTERMEAPIYLYYKLTNYYQNHRRYVRSRSDVQLMGDDVTLEDVEQVSSCRYHVQHDANDPSSIISPCGLIAWSVFNDSFKLFKPSGGEVMLDGQGIAWSTDVKTKFKNSPNGSTGAFFPPFAHERQQVCADLPTAEQRTACAESPATPQAGWCYPGSGYCVEDEHFMVWMRAAGLPSFRKLYAVISEDLAPGNYTVQVSNGVLVDGAYRNAWDGYEVQRFLYPVSSFGGTKSIVLSTKSWIGGRNFFIGYAYVIVGVICIVLALCFLVKYKLSPRDLADASYISHVKAA